MANPTPFGMALRQARTARGLTQAALAAEVATSAAYVSQLESGMKTSPSEDVRGRLLSALGADLADALREAGEPVPEPQATPDPGRAVADLVASMVAPGDLQPLGLIAPGRALHLPLDALGTDDAGQLWIAPTAPALPVGRRGQDPRVERDLDGRFWVDLSDLPTPPGPREPDRHLLHAIRAVAVPSDPIPFGEYEQTVLHLHVDDEEWAVHPAEPGTADGPYPQLVEAVHVLSAANPERRILTDAENAVRHAALLADLDEHGIPSTAARTEAPDVPHAPGEESVAIFGLPRSAVLAIARRHGQSSIFEWTPTERSVITADGRAYVTGWRARVAQADLS